MQQYKTIYSDPPWNEQGGGKIKRGADRHYKLMKTKDIANLKIPSEDNAHLYLWVTNNFLKDGLFVMEKWGFTYKTMITWVKDRFGLGQYFRGMTEHCLFGVKGCLPYKIIDNKRQQGLTVLFENRTKHSVKPEKMRKMIEKVSYPPYLELFARRKVSLELFEEKDSPNWDIWGEEVESDIKIEEI